ncbi:MAG: carbon starvation protein A, partial [Lentisphaerae bacterium]|nr:carbon starvation protein A [Lentisphaerota bacterium]
DGVDYVPTRPGVLFGHHFASIAGAGPIVGPVAAAYLGWGPVVLWILLGCVFIGAFHDFAALFLSIRHEGRSIGSVIEDYLGVSGRISFLLFCWVALVLVVAVFAILVAKTFVKTPEVATASLLFVAMAPVFGYLVYRRGLSILAGSLIFVPLLFVFIWVGTLIPADLVRMGLAASPESAQKIWLVVLFVYVSVASIVPVWLLLQPRDYLNSYLLYAMVLLGFAGILFVRPEFNMPAFVGWAAQDPKGSIANLFPILYVTVACGACSGFHALVSSGTTAKQLDSERHILPIGYGAMLVEGLVALMALISVAVLTKDNYADMLKDGTAVSAFASGLASFSARLGLPESIGVTFFALTISAFMLTTLDTATRLTRFTWQELFLPAHGHEREKAKPWRTFAAHSVTATLIAVAGAGTLAFSGSVWQIWPVFGASNQLLAALTLLVVTLFLVRKKANFWVALAPTIFMSVITVWALVELLQRNIRAEGQLLLVVATGILLALALALAAMSVWSLRKSARS